jgi:hypothetical protein
MQFPIWGTSYLAGKVGLATVAILLVFVAHAAAGLGVIYSFSLNRAQRFLRKNTPYILLLPSVVTMVLILGLWTYASLVRPALVSTIVHVFMWLLAIQAIAIILQNLAAYALSYHDDRLTPSRRTFISWIYTACAIIPVIVINVVASFMLTPGRWLATFNFWDALINPTFIPSLLLHIAWALVLGCTSLIVIINLSTDLTADEKHDLEKLSGKWMWVLAAAVPIAPLYLMAAAKDSPLMLVGLALTLVVVLQFFVAQFLRSDRIGFTTSLTLMLILLTATASYDLAQARMRGPYDISGYLYSNGIAVADVEELKREGILANASWIVPHSINLARVPSPKRGQWIYQALRYEWYFGNDAKSLRQRIHGMDKAALRDYIQNIDRFDPSVPPFIGNPQELDDLVDYLLTSPRGED